MEHILPVLHTLWSFFIVLSVIVFIHEFGHYIVAKWCGVKIEVFSIGFGKELLGWTDKSGTRWKIALLPLGGFVKMYGDSSAASTADNDAMEKMSDADRALTFHHKSLAKKAAIVAAGPMANFILTIALFTYFIMTSGLPSVEPVVGQIMPASPAEAAGLKQGDRVLKINDDAVESFNDIPFYISTNLGTPVTLLLLRDGKEMNIVLTPKEVEDVDGLGNKVKRPLIGIKSPEIKYTNAHIFEAVGEATRRTYMLCVTTLRAIGQMITGERGAKDLTGPIGIAQMSGQATEKSFETTLWLIAVISANLGLVNLFPIPVLDGGHLLYYSVEAMRGRPMAERFQEWGFRFGFAVLGLLMAFTIFNDIRKLFS